MEPELPFRNVDLHVAVPDGAVSWKLLHDGSPQLIQPLATAAPKITRVAAVPDPANRVIHLRWSATGASFYRLFYQRSPKTPQMLIANGLTDSAFDALTDFLPPAPHGIFTLVASNGNLTTEQTMEEEVSSAVSVSISGPPPGTVVLAGEPITFEALAQLGAEPLDEAKYKWSIDGHVIREVGEGATLTRALTVGPHTVAVQVTSRHPHTNTTATLDVDVSPPPP